MMIQMICRVISQSEKTSVTTKNGEMAKCFVRLKAIGNDFADEFLCAVVKNAALVNYEKDELVAATLNFRVYEANGGIHQSVEASEIVKIKH